MTLAEAVRHGWNQGAEFYHTATLGCYLVVFRPKLRKRWRLFGRVISTAWERQIYQRDWPLFDKEHVWFLMDPWHRLPRRDLEFAMTTCFASIGRHPALTAGDGAQEAQGG